jgi:hypothetical protein
MLKYLAGLAVFAAAIGGTAQAATNLNGTYSIRYTTLCQSIENEVFKPSTQIITLSLGKISQTVGFMTFTPSAAGALSGTVLATATASKGSLTILGLPGPPAQPAVPDMALKSAKPQAGSYTLKVGAATAPSTLSITFSGQPSEVFTAYVSKPKNGVFTHADFIGIDGDAGKPPSCSNAGSIDQ